MKIKQYRYKCRECQSIYDDKYEAIDCCEGIIDTIEDELNACIICGNFYNDPESSAKCQEKHEKSEDEYYLVYIQTEKSKNLLLEGNKKGQSKIGDYNGK